MVRTSLNLLALGLVVLAFVAGGCGGAEQQADQAPAMAHPESLWSMERLAAAGDSLLLIDVRRGEDYATGHIPGARRVWRSDFTVEVDGGEALGRYGGMACGPEALAGLVDSLGGVPSGQIVLYDGVGGCDAARVWWLLRLYGHREVALLDGGVPAWLAAGHEIATDAPAPATRRGFRYTAPAHEELLVTLEEVEAARLGGHSIILDTRSAEEYTGEMHKKGAAKAGRIPGAVHYDWGNAVDMGGVGALKPLKDLVHDLGNLGIRPDTPVITYCHSGVRSAHTAFVLREMLGYKNVRNYDGSWTEYSRIEVNEGTR